MITMSRLSPSNPGNDAIGPVLVDGEVTDESTRTKNAAEGMFCLARVEHPWDQQNLLVVPITTFP